MSSSPPAPLFSITPKLEPVDPLLLPQDPQPLALTMASSSSPSPPSAISPKLEPDDPLLLPQDSNLLALTPQLCDMLQRELAPSPNDDPAFVRCLVQSQLHLQAIAAQLRAPAAAPTPSQPDQEVSLPGSSNAKKRARPVVDVVRVTNISVADHIHFRALIRRARLTFEALRGVYQRQELSSGGRNRSDLRASSRMLSAGHWLNRDHRIVGRIPGILVGDAFYYRAELCVVGLHSAPQAGISYIPANHVPEGNPIATSIVSSGGYLDDEDNGDVLIYTGSGGRQRNRRDHHADQTLERGNLALHNSYLYGLEVRVIRGHTWEASPNGKIYIYDGLYRVVSATFGPGKSGRDVCKFKLVRLTGQDDIGSNTWNIAKHLKDTIDAQITPPNYISLDLSGGKEPLGVPVFNEVDDDKSPLDFEYTVCPGFSLAPTLAPTALIRKKRGCHCEAECGSRCNCNRKNVGGSAYNEDGTLIMGRPVVYECGALCGCPLACMNRVTQQGMKHRLEVFRSKETEWGVRTLDLIQPGAFVCEFSGDVVVTNDQFGSSWMEGRSIIDPKNFPPRWRDWGDTSNVDPNIKVPKFREFLGPGYVLDVSQRRNVACYISHSFTPNVFLQYVLHGNEDESRPHLMVFAMETIPPMRELSIDYGM